MTEVPIAILDSEVIVRAICHPYHFDKKGRLKWFAYRPPPEETKVSVLRHNYLGGDACKQKGQSLNAEGKTYAGLAFSTAKGIKAARVGLIDSREEFLGHADIVHAQPAPPRHAEPDSAELDVLRTACKKILESTVFIKDPYPDGQSWTCGCPTLSEPEIS
jgi:hypothetical protein